MPKPAKHALAVLAAPELVVAKDSFKQLEAAAVAQCHAVGALESQAAVGAIIAGITLHRVKASLPHTKFDAWKIQKLTKVNFWTPGTAKVNASYYMRLALVFIEKSRAAKAELLALPADGKTELKLDATPAGKKLGASLEKFVDGLSLTELLIKYRIKGVGLKTALTDDEDEAADGAPAAANIGEQLWLDLWQMAQQGRDPNQLQHLTDPKKVETLIGEIQETERALKARLDALRGAKKA